MANYKYYSYYIFTFIYTLLVFKYAASTTYVSKSKSAQVRPGQQQIKNLKPSKKDNNIVRSHLRNFVPNPTSIP